MGSQAIQMGLPGVAPPGLGDIGASMNPNVPLSRAPESTFGGLSVGAPNANNGFESGFGNGSFLNAGSRTRGNRTNQVIPCHFVVCPDLSDPSSAQQVSSLGVGMLLFARSQQTPAHIAKNDTTLKMFKQEPYVVQSHNTSHFMEWSQLCGWLANNSSRYTKASEVLDEWQFAGGLKNEVTPNTTSNYGRRAHTRMINLNVRGPFSAFNIWGKRIFPGMELYFVIKKGYVDSCFGSSNMPGAKKQLSGFDFMEYWKSSAGDDSVGHISKRMRLADNEASQADNAKAEIRKQVWKIVPWASDIKRGAVCPQYADLVYYDISPGGEIVQREGVAIKVGHAYYSEGSPAPSDAARSRGDFSDTIGLFNRGLLSNIELCLGV